MGESVEIAKRQILISSIFFKKAQKFLNPETYDKNTPFLPKHAPRARSKNPHFLFFLGCSKFLAANRQFSGGIHLILSLPWMVQNRTPQPAVLKGNSIVPRKHCTSWGGRVFFHSHPERAPKAAPFENWVHGCSWLWMSLPLSMGSGVSSLECNLLWRPTAAAGW